MQPDGQAPPVRRGDAAIWLAEMTVNEDSTAAHLNRRRPSAEPVPPKRARHPNRRLRATRPRQQHAEAAAAAMAIHEAEETRRQQRRPRRSAGEGGLPHHSAPPAQARGGGAGRQAAATRLRRAYRRTCHPDSFFWWFFLLGISCWVSLTLLVSLKNRDAYHVRSDHESDVAGTEHGRPLPLFRSGLDPESGDEDEERYIFYNVSAHGGIEVYTDDSGPQLENVAFEGVDPAEEDTEELMKLMSSGLLKGIKLSGAKPAAAGKPGHAGAKTPSSVHVKIKQKAASSSTPGGAAASEAKDLKLGITLRSPRSSSSSTTSGSLPATTAPHLPATAGTRRVGRGQAAPVAEANSGPGEHAALETPVQGDEEGEAEEVLIHPLLEGAAVAEEGEGEEGGEGRAAPHSAPRRGPR
eukprot:jgi/Tetstr1/459090/TSEL_004540.t1